MNYLAIPGISITVKEILSVITVIIKPPSFFHTLCSTQNTPLVARVDKITMAEQERRKWTLSLPRKISVAIIVLAAFTSSLSLICGVSVSRELGNLPDDFLLNAQARALGSTFLAYQQSYGFFDDIPDESWKLMQQHALKSLSFHYRDPSLPEATVANPEKGFLNNMQVSGRFQETKTTFVIYLCRPFVLLTFVRLTCVLAARIYLPSSQSCRPAGERPQVDLRP